jgi:hypothetical protein
MFQNIKIKIISKINYPVSALLSYLSRHSAAASLHFFFPIYKTPRRSYTICCCSDSGAGAVCPLPSKTKHQPLSLASLLVMQVPPPPLWYANSYALFNVALLFSVPHCMPSLCQTLHARSKFHVSFPVIFVVAIMFMLPPYNSIEQGLPSLS